MSLKKCFIIPYYGSWPCWMEHFLYTCTYNKGYTFIFFTDIPIPEQKSDNVVFYKMTLNELTMLASEKTGYDITLPAVYKLCDLKLAFGKIFEDYLSDFHYWGHLDVDVLLGNIDSVLSDEIISQYDVISTRADMINGSFTMYRNTKVVNTMYTAIPELNALINSNQLYLTEEFFLTHIIYIYERMEKIKPLFKEFVFEDALFECRGKNSWMLRMKNGQLINAFTKKPVLYFHFILSKKRPVFLSSFITKFDGTEFFITNNGIQKFNTFQYYRSITISYFRDFNYHIRKQLKAMLRR